MNMRTPDRKYTGNGENCHHHHSQPGCSHRRKDLHCTGIFGAPNDLQPDSVHCWLFLVSNLEFSQSTNCGVDLPAQRSERKLHWSDSSESTHVGILPKTATYLVSSSTQTEPSTNKQRNTLWHLSGCLLGVLLVSIDTFPQWRLNNITIHK